MFHYPSRLPNAVLRCHLISSVFSSIWPGVASQEIVDDKTLQSREEPCKARKGNMEDVHRKCGERAGSYDMWVLNSLRYPAVLRRAHRSFFDRTPGRCSRDSGHGVSDTMALFLLQTSSCMQSGLHHALAQIQVASERLSKHFVARSRLLACKHPSVRGESFVVMTLADTC